MFSQHFGLRSSGRITMVVLPSPSDALLLQGSAIGTYLRVHCLLRKVPVIDCQL